MKAYVRGKGSSIYSDHASGTVGAEYRVRLTLFQEDGDLVIDPDQVKASLEATMDRAFGEWCANNGVTPVYPTQARVLSLGGAL